MNNISAHQNTLRANIFHIFRNRIITSLSQKDICSDF